MSKDLTIAQKVATHVEMSAHAIQKGLDAERKLSELSTKVASHIPATVQALIAAKVISEAEKSAAERVLADPEATIQLLARVAGGMHQKAAAAAVGSLGTPTGGNVTRKSASDKSESHAYRAFRTAILGN